MGALACAVGLGLALVWALGGTKGRKPARPVAAAPTPPVTIPSFVPPPSVPPPNLPAPPPSPPPDDPGAAERARLAKERAAVDAKDREREKHLAKALEARPKLLLLSDSDILTLCLAHYDKPEFWKYGRLGPRDSGPPASSMLPDEANKAADDMRGCREKFKNAVVRWRVFAHKWSSADFGNGLQASLRGRTSFPSFDAHAVAPFSMGENRERDVGSVPGYGLWFDNIEFGRDGRLLGSGYAQTLTVVMPYECALVFSMSGRSLAIEFEAELTGESIQQEAALGASPLRCVSRVVYARARARWIRLVDTRDDRVAWQVEVP